MLGKTHLLVLTVLFFSVGIYAQVPNGGFEQWSNGEPVGWSTNNIVATTITQTSDAHQGSFAVKGTIVSVNSAILEPLLISGEIGGKGFSVTQRYASITGYYKFSPVGNDLFDVVVGMWKNGQAIGVGGAEFNAASAYTAFSVPITYVSSQVPDSCMISITIDNGNNTQAGSVFYVDDISLNTGATSVNDKMHPLAYNLSQNYPNPFNPSTTIGFQLPDREDVLLTIYNSLGKEVKTLVDGSRNAGNFRVTWNGKDNHNMIVPSGIYFYRIQTGNFSESRKMILLK